MGHSHRHNEVELNYIVCGSITYYFGSSIITFSERSLGLFWAAMPHQLVQSEPNTYMFWITLPLALFLKWDLPPALSKQVLDGKPVSASSTPMDEMQMRRWRSDLDAAEHETCNIMLLELEARLRRMAREIGSQDGAPVSRPGGRAPSSAGANKAERMSHYIAEHFTEPLRVEQIARSVHIHPTYAMHLFRETFGISIIDYLTQHRIAHAQQLLATSDKSVMEVALECGFNSVSRFYTAFNAICGKSPRAYRESLR